MTATPSSTAPTELIEAQSVTRRIARHYENFTVVSIVLPKNLRQDFYNIYAFCRHADDLADEIESSQESLTRLNQLKLRIESMYGKQSTDYQPPSGDETAILVALRDTVQRFEIPPDPFLKLIDAFKQDRQIHRYDTYEKVLDYCTRSANPVGHLVLYLCGYRDAERQRLSDFTCTALQLTNFWQDVVPDLARGRIYIPQDDMNRMGVPESDLHQRLASKSFIDLMKFEVDRTEYLFGQGEALLPLIDKRYRTDIALYTRGGRAILDRIRKLGYNVLAQRPSISKWTKLTLLARVLLRK